MRYPVGPDSRTFMFDAATPLPFASAEVHVDEGLTACPSVDLLLGGDCEGRDLLLGSIELGLAGARRLVSD